MSDWGECAWTAADLQGSNPRLDARSVGYLFGLSERAIRSIEDSPGPSYQDWEDAYAEELRIRMQYASERINDALTAPGALSLGDTASWIAKDPLGPWK